MFQHTAARRRLFFLTSLLFFLYLFQHTAARRRLLPRYTRHQTGGSFNTQPPEGGWILNSQPFSFFSGFNTQPPEGGCLPAHKAMSAGVFQHTAARRRLSLS